MANLSELIGKRLKEARKEKGLRQEDLEGNGISYKYYQKIEAGRANITLSTLEKIALALGINATDLFLFSLDLDEQSNELILKISKILSDDDKVKLNKLLVFVDKIL